MEAVGGQVFDVVFGAVEERCGMGACTQVEGERGGEMATEIV